MADSHLERVERELNILREGGQEADITESTDGNFVIYKNVPTQRECDQLPKNVDVIVPIPAGYAASVIDLAGIATRLSFAQIGQRRKQHSRKCLC